MNVLEFPTPEQLTDSIRSHGGMEIVQSTLPELMPLYMCDSNMSAALGEMSKSAGVPSMIGHTIFVLGLVVASFYFNDKYHDQIQKEAGGDGTMKPPKPKYMDPEKFYTLGCPLDFAENMIDELNRQRYWLTNRGSELVGLGIIDALMKKFPEQASSWKDRFPFTFTEADNIRRTQNELTADRPGWNDYYMIQWYVTHDPTFTRQLIRRIVGTADIDISSSGIWMLRSVGSKHPDLLRQIHDYVWSEEFPESLRWARAHYNDYFGTEIIAKARKATEVNSTVKG